MTALGAYTLISEVARGGQGRVYEGRAPDGRRVAVKVLLAERSSTPEGRARFEREARALLRLRHPGVVELVDGGVAGEHRFLVMEWVDGETLEARIERDGPLAPRAAADLVRRVAEAVAHCHGQGVLHRDLKPSNVLVRRDDGAPVLTDFGIARSLEQEQARDGTTTLNLTVRGRCLGTPAFWSPEQALGRVEQIGPRSDVYGLGGLLFFALTAGSPNPGEGLIEQLASLMARRVRSPRELRDDVPEPLDALCRRCLAHDAADRPESARVVERELAAWLASPPEPPRIRVAVGPARPAGAPRIKVLRVRQPAEASNRLVIRNAILPGEQVAGGAAERERLFAGLVDQVVAQGALEPWRVAFLRRLATRFDLPDERVEALLRERGAQEEWVSPARG